MSDTKRVLWVEDNETALNDSIKSLFDNAEKKSIDNIHQAIDEIASKRLYDYDTIVLDIDFRDDNSSNFPYVIKKLKEKIYLRKDQCVDDGEYAFIKENGGYLLFLYLLERGYPSDRIAFLTGNQDIINKLRIYTAMNKDELSREEIAQLFLKKWEEAEGDYDDFEGAVYDMYNIESEFRETDFVEACEEALDEEDYDQLLELVRGVHIVTYDSRKDNPQEYENDMIFRFHKANLESPVYFTKHESSIAGHDLADARAWLNERRTTNKVLRWLALSAGKYIENLWKNEDNNMTQRVRNVLRMPSDDDPSYDFGVRSAYRQMTFVYDGLKVVSPIEAKGINYQAISVLLIPFEANIRDGETGDLDLKMRRDMAYCAKKARNYTAHNYFGSAISDANTLFLLMIAVTSILKKSERESIKNWYWKASKEIQNSGSLGFGSSFCSSVSTGGPDGTGSFVSSAAELAGTGADHTDAVIDTLIQQLWNENKISNKCKVSKDKPLADYSCKEYVDVLSWYEEMKKDTVRRERYYIFTLAAYIVKLFKGYTDEDIETQFGYGVKVLHNIARQII